MKVKVFLSIIGLFLIIGCVADQTKYLPLKERSDYDLCVSYFTDYFSLLTQKEKYRKYKQIVGEIEKRTLPPSDIHLYSPEPNKDHQR